MVEVEVEGVEEGVCRGLGDVGEGMVARSVADFWVGYVCGLGM